MTLRGTSEMTAEGRYFASNNNCTKLLGSQTIFQALLSSRDNT